MSKQYCRYKNKKANRIYRIWLSMRQRCNNSSHKYYRLYGGRGIKVCDEWQNDYDAFAEWAIQNGYSDTMSIDRIDNDKGYCPDNCRWIYYKDQPKNRRTNHRVVVNGKEMNVSDVSRIYNIPISTVCYRDKRGFDILHGHRRRAIKCVETGEVYKSLSEASRKTGIYRGQLSACANGKREKAGGYHWQIVAI